MMPNNTHKDYHTQSNELRKLLAAQRPVPRWYTRTSLFVRSTPGALGWLLTTAGIIALTLLLVCACTAKACAATPSDRLIDALVKVESNGDARAVGDNGKALGCLQIWSVVVEDVNQVSSVKYTHADALDPAKARAICRAYLARYCTAKRLGHPPTDEDFARVWNGGPDGWRKNCTIKYWQRVANVLN